MTRVLWLAETPTERLTEVASENGADVHVVRMASLPELLLYMRHALGDVIVVTIKSPGPRTDDLLLELLRAEAGLPVIVDCESASTDDVVHLVRLGAYHVWVEAQDPEGIRTRLAAAHASAPQPQLTQARTDEPWRASMVGCSEPMARVFDVVRLVAARRSSILITGETGTGKEVVARAIHMAGGRSNMPFVAVNCSAIPETLVESELFGYVKGAFTGAIQSRPGKFEQADGGTIFLDEVGELPLDMQAKLLRVLQEREVQRIGSGETVKLNVRVIAATNANLEEAVQKKTFREDLYYRLNVVPVHLPPLRDRVSDIPALVDCFLRRICEVEGLELRRVTAGALEAIRRYSWPGNVRQLEHAIEMAVVLSGNRTVLDIADFPAVVQDAAPQGFGVTAVVLPETGLDFEDTVSRFERSILQQALLRSSGNKARAAQLLRMKRTTLLARMKSLESYGGAVEEYAEPACA